MDKSRFEKQFAEAKRRGKEKMETEPRAKSVRYDRTSKRVVVDLINGSTFMFPASLVQGLSEAKPEDLADVSIAGPGTALHWEKLDADFSLAGLMMGIFGTRKWMSEIGRLAGKVKSEKKAKTSAENGSKGGRPPKKSTVA